MMQQEWSLERYAKIARQAAAEGCVLLKNDNQTLPLRKNDRVAVFGRCASYYYKSGLGSGGLVNTRYVVSILDALKKCEMISLEEELLAIYEKWQEENPVEEGNGWGTTPWSQEEMPITDEVLKAAENATVAIVIIGRTAGEDQDNGNEPGSYLLTQTEKDMIAKVTKAFDRTIVLLNVGNIIDMKWVEEYNPSAVMYVWQGGQEGGNGVVDTLTGKVNPCGKLTDTIAYHIEDYPSTPYYGDPLKNYYKEDIYVGYRYFETFAKEKVQYPFGYGMSYTTFAITAAFLEEKEDLFTVEISVKNTGALAGKEVVQIYVEQPNGKLGKPERVLTQFIKTKELAPGEEEQQIVECPKTYFASYDDAGVTGHKSCFILEAGTYKVHVGNHIRNTCCCGSWEQKEQVVQTLQEACAPVESFERFKNEKDENSKNHLLMEAVPLRTVKTDRQLEQQKNPLLTRKQEKEYCLQDVEDKKITMDEFVSQLTDEDLISLFHGEGMCSPKVTPGTAGAFGGVTESLMKKGVPVACCADGPSGIRMDCGAKAFSIANGTALGCSYNMDLVYQLFDMLGMEMVRNKVDTLLGPGINIHRNPLNGRNFEYVSEDPVLTGKMCVAQLKGLHRNGVYGTMKHFCANNQEKERCNVEAVVSERALREIYLRPFEMGVREGNAKSVMTTYGPVNGIWTAGNYDLCTKILRQDWNFKGIVMTDWWGTANDEGKKAEKTNRQVMVYAQNDIYMCCGDALEELHQDNVKTALENGILKKSTLQRNAKNICEFLMNAICMHPEKLEEISMDADDDDNMQDGFQRFAWETGRKELIIDEQNMDLKQEEILFELTDMTNENYQIAVEMKSPLAELAQLPVSIYMDNIYRGMLSFQGTNGKTVRKEMELGTVIGKNHYIRLVVKGKGIEITQIQIFPK